jgi:hypothetical protein
MHPPRRPPHPIRKIGGDRESDADVGAARARCFPRPRKDAEVRDLQVPPPPLHNSFFFLLEKDLRNSSFASNLSCLLLLDVLYPLSDASSV